MRTENELCHLCSYCCGVNKPEPNSHFSLYLLTHSGFPACHIPPSFITKRQETVWVNRNSNLVHILPNLCCPSERAAGIVTTWLAFTMMHILQNWHWVWLLLHSSQKAETFIHIILLWSYKKLLWILPNWKKKIFKMLRSNISRLLVYVNTT